MSVERLRRRLILTVSGARVVEQAIEGVGSIFHAAGAMCEGIAEAAFLVQADSARQYHDLTGSDLAEDLGYENLYDGARSEEVLAEDDDEE